MREKLKKLSPLWTALTAVALAGVIAFAVLVGAGVSAAGGSDAFPVPAASGAVRMAEDDTYFAAADEDGLLSCYNKADGTLLFSYRKPAEDGSESGGAGVLSVSLYDGQVFALYSDRQVLRFSADGDGTPAGALETNYVPQQAYFPSSGSLFAVFGVVGARKEVYLLRTDFGGTPAEPVSYRDYPKLDGGEYAVSSGGVETGVQGICVTADEHVYVASDVYTVRKFTANGMADGYEQFDIAAQKLAAFCETETGFAGLDLAGDFYRFDDTFHAEYILHTGQTLDTVLCAGGTFYGAGGGRVIGVRAEEGLLFNVASEGASLLMATENAFVLSGSNGARYVGVELARQLASYAGLLPVYIPLLVVFALLFVFAGLHAWRPLGACVNHALAVCGRTFVKHKFAYLGLIPTFALLAVFYYWPIVHGFALSFFNYNGVTSEFVGFRNFGDVLQNTIFWNSTLNMFVLLVTDLVKALVPPLIFAEFILAVRSKRFSFAVRVLLFIPGILPGVAGTLVWVNGIFGSDSYGLLNSIGSLFVPGFMQTWIGPYLETRSLVSIIMFSFPWVGSYLIFYGGVMGIPKSLFEAAELDGCGWWRRMATIDLPLIFAQIKYIFITSFIASVQDYGRLFITDQSTGHGLKVPALIIYESIYKGGSEPNYGLSSAMSMFLFLFLLAATILSFRKQTSKEEL